jgi:hypothetical protein
MPAICGHFLLKEVIVSEEFFDFVQASSRLWQFFLENVLYFLEGTFHP